MSSAVWNTVSGSAGFSLGKQPRPMGSPFPYILQSFGNMPVRVRIVEPAIGVITESGSAARAASPWNEPAICTTRFTVSYVLVTRPRRIGLGNQSTGGIAAGSDSYSAAPARRTPQSPPAQRAFLHHHEKNRHQNQHVNRGRNHAADNRRGNRLHHIRANTGRP